MSLFDPKNIETGRAIVEAQIKRQNLTVTKALEALGEHGYKLTKKTTATNSGTNASYTLGAHESGNISYNRVKDFLTVLSSYPVEDTLLHADAYTYYSTLISMARQQGYPRNKKITEIPPDIATAVLRYPGMRVLLEDGQLAIEHTDTPELGFRMRASDTVDDIKSRLKRYDKARLEYLDIKDRLGKDFIMPAGPFEAVLAAAKSYIKVLDKEEARQARLKAEEELAQQTQQQLPPPPPTAPIQEVAPPEPPKEEAPKKVEEPLPPAPVATPVVAELPMERMQKPVQRLPDRKPVTLIFDACAVDDLAAPRDKQNNTWLDLLTETAKLPNVTIVIPAYIADWELRGAVSQVTKDGKATYREIDPRYATKPELMHITKSVNKLLEHATRARSKPNDEIVMVPPASGTPSNIVIWETKKCREAFREISDKKWEKIRRKFQHQDYGETCVEQFINAETPFQSPVIVVTEDKHYEEGRIYARSYTGQPVGMARIRDYVEAEMRTRQDDITARLGSPDVTSYNIMHAIYERTKKRYAAKGKSITPESARFTNHEKVGEDIRGGRAESLYEVLERGVQLSHLGISAMPLQKLIALHAEASTTPAHMRPMAPPAHSDEEHPMGRAMNYLMGTMTPDFVAGEMNKLSKPEFYPPITPVTRCDVEAMLSGKYRFDDDHFLALAETLIWRNPKVGHGEKHQLCKQLLALQATAQRHDQPSVELGKMVSRLSKRGGLDPVYRFVEKFNNNAGLLRGNHHEFAGEEISNIISGHQHTNSIFVNKFLTVIEHLRKEMGEPAVTEAEKYALFSGLDRELAKGYLSIPVNGNGNGYHRR